MQTAWEDSILLSTGMEDYYDSAFYFDGGLFHGEVSLWRQRMSSVCAIVSRPHRTHTDTYRCRGIRTRTTMGVGQDTVSMKLTPSSSVMASGSSGVTAT